MQLTSTGTPAQVVDAPRLVTRWANRNRFNRLTSVAPYTKTRFPWFLSPSNKTLTTAPFPSGMAGRSSEAPIPRLTRKAGLTDGSRPHRTISGPRWWMSRWPSSTSARCRSGSSSLQHNACAPGHKTLVIVNARRRTFASDHQFSCVRALRMKTHGFRGNADQSDNRRPRSPLGNPASVDQTSIRPTRAAIADSGYCLTIPSRPCR
jgi:hypothetical protein